MSDWSKFWKEVNREVRDVRDWAIGKSDDAVEAEALKRINDFWDDQPWYMKLFRKQIMQYAYRIFKSIS